MPYHIRHRPGKPNQAKVYKRDLRSDRAGQDARRAYDGTPLSKKWLTVAQATKQLIAVRIHESDKK